MSRNQVSPESVVASLAIAAVVVGVALIAVRPAFSSGNRDEVGDLPGISMATAEAMAVDPVRMSDEELVVSAATKLGDKVVKDFKGNFKALKARFGSLLYFAVNADRAESGYAVRVVDMMDYAMECMTKREYGLFRERCRDDLQIWFSVDANIIEMTNR